MEENPYHRILELFGGTSSAEQLTFGLVTSAPSRERPGIPLRVLVKGNTMDEGELMKDARFGRYDFASGDQLLLLPVDGDQRFVILCKVVAV